MFTPPVQFNWKGSEIIQLRENEAVAGMILRPEWEIVRGTVGRGGGHKKVRQVTERPFAADVLPWINEARQHSPSWRNKWKLCTAFRCS